MLTLTVHCDQLASGKPLVLNLEAEQGDRSALAARFDWIDVSSLTAEIKLKAIAKDAYHVSGQIACGIIQRCRVTENPVPESLMVTVDERFAIIEDQGEEAEIDPMAMTVEAIENNEIPVGEMIAQLVGLEASTWPRDAAADDYLKTDEIDPTNPFASLAELKKKL